MARVSSADSPWLATSTSRRRATYQGPSCVIAAVNSIKLILPRGPRAVTIVVANVRIGEPVDLGSHNTNCSAVIAVPLIDPAVSSVAWHSSGEAVGLTCLDQATVVYNDLINVEQDRRGQMDCVECAREWRSDTPGETYNLPGDESLGHSRQRCLHRVRLGFLHRSLDQSTAVDVDPHVRPGRRDQEDRRWSLPAEVSDA